MTLDAVCDGSPHDFLELISVIYYWVIRYRDPPFTDSAMKRSISVLAIRQRHMGFT